MHLSLTDILTGFQISGLYLQRSNIMAAHRREVSFVDVKSVFCFVYPRAAVCLATLMLCQNPVPGNNRAHCRTRGEKIKPDQPEKSRVGVSSGDLVTYLHTFRHTLELPVKVRRLKTILKDESAFWF